MHSNKETDKILIIFDDHCVLCNSFARFVAKRDQKKQVQFELRSERKIQQEFIVVIHNEKEYTQTEAIVIILKSLNRFWRVIGSFINLFPLSFSNFFYRWIAKNRKKWWGEQNECTMDEEVLERIVKEL